MENRRMNSKDTFDAMSAILPDSKPTGKLTAKTPLPRSTTVEITPAGPKVGWPTKTFTEYQQKDITKWNNNDIRWYFNDAYYKRYGHPARITEIRLFNSNVSQILYTLQLRLGEEPPKGMFKDYIDYYFSRHADDEIKTRGTLKFYALTKSRVILMFIDYMQSSASDKPVEVETVQPEIQTLSIDNLLSAYRIAPASLLCQYGKIVTINYLLHRGKSIVEAEQYVEKGLSKMSIDDKQLVTDAAAKWSPYPVWLKFIPDNTITCQDNKMFECFKESK